MDCDFDYPEFYRERTVKAKKLHVCVECRGKIVPGESYSYHTGRTDGEFWGVKQCADCKYVICLLNDLKLYDCSGWAFGSMREVLREIGRWDSRRDAVKQAFAAYNATATLRGGIVVHQYEENVDDNAAVVQV